MLDSDALESIDEHCDWVSSFVNPNVGYEALKTIKLQN